MAELQDIVTLSSEYIFAHNQVKERQAAWNLGAFKLTRETLEEIKTEIISQNEYFNANLYVSTLGNSPMKSLCLMSGNISVTTSNNTLSEKGFEIHFHIMANGKIHCYALEHIFDESRDGKYHSLEVVENPSDLTKQKVIDLVYLGMSKIYKSSYLFEE